MKLRMIVLTIAMALIGASVAVANDNGGWRGGHNGCGHRGKVLLRGVLANDPAAGDTSFQLTVKRVHWGRHGRALRHFGQPVTIKVNADTKVRRFVAGSAPTTTLDSLAQGDRVMVWAKVSRTGMAKMQNANHHSMQLTARLVKARPAATVQKVK